MIKKNKGFSLIEILLVIALVAILAGIAIFAVNPGKQLADTRNAERKTDVNTILNAVYQYSIDNNGVLPESIGVTSGEICKDGFDPEEDDCDVDLSILVENEKYLVAFPEDPSNVTTADGIGYEISKSINGRITVTAPSAENDETISITR